MKKDSGGFQGFMLQNFEKIALGVFGVLVLVFLVFATVLGSYYDREASELVSMVNNKVTSVTASGREDNFEGLRGVEVTPYDKQLTTVPVPEPPPEGEVDGVISYPGPVPNKRTEPAVLPPIDLRGFGVREVLAFNGKANQSTNSGEGGAGSNRGVGSSDGGGGASSAVGLGEGDNPGQGDDGGDQPANNPEPAGAEAPPATGYQPPVDSRTAVRSYITLVATVPHAAQYQEFISKTLNTLPPGPTEPRYITFRIQRRTQGGSEQWEELDRDVIKEIIDEVRIKWVSSNVEELVDDRYLFPMFPTEDKYDFVGFSLPPAPAIGRVWGASMVPTSIPSKDSGPVYRPLDDMIGQWQAARRSHVNFLANQEAYDGQQDVVAVIGLREQFNITAGEEANRVIFTTPGDDEAKAPFQAGVAFNVIDDGSSNTPVANPKIAELRRPGDVILKHADKSWWEIYRKTSDEELQRTTILFLDGKDMATEAVVFEQALRKYESRQGFNSTNNEPAQEAATPAPQAAQGPSNFMFRFYDTTVEAGKTYQYRISLVLANPNYGVNPGYLDESADATQEHLETDWSEPTEWISVTSYADLVIGPTNPGSAGSAPKVGVYLREPSSDQTPLKEANAVAMLLTQFKAAARGQWMNYVVDNPAAVDIVHNAPAQLDLGEGAQARRGFTHRYRTDEMILDMRGGETHGKLRVPGETLILDANGNLVVKSELTSGFETAEYQYGIVNETKSRRSDDGDDPGNQDGVGGSLPPGGGGGE